MAGEQRVKEIEERVSKATKGPWKWNVHDHSAASIEGPDEEMSHVLTLGPCKSCQAGVLETKKFFGACTVPNNADAEFLANSREDIPYLLSALQELVKERDAVKLDMDQQIKALVEEIEDIEKERDAALHREGKAVEVLKYIDQNCIGSPDFLFTAEEVKMVHDVIHSLPEHEGRKEGIIHTPYPLDTPPDKTKNPTTGERG